MVVALVDDMLFGSRIRAAADRAARAVTFVRRDSIVAAVAEHHPRLVIVDLDRTPLDPIASIRLIRSHADPAVAATPIIAFVSHVRADLIEAARAAGATQVLARSVFVTRLSDLMADAPTGATHSL